MANKPTEPSQQPKPSAGGLPPQPTSKPPPAAPGPKKDIDSYFGSDSPQPKPAEPPKAPAQTPAPKEPEAAPAKSDQPPSEPKPAESKTSVPDVLEGIIGTPVQPKSQKTSEAPAEQLRSAYERVKTELGNTRKQFDERVKQLEAENAKLSESLKYADYTRSPEYEQQYVTPLKKRLEAAYALAKRLPVGDGDRTGTPDDINDLYQLWRRNPASAINAAREKFDAAAQVIIDQVSGIAEAENEAAGAVESFKTQAQERDSKRQERIRHIWESTISEQVEQRPDLFRFDEDPELKPVSEKCAAYADAAFLGAESLSEEELVKVRAVVRNMAASFGPLAHDRARLQKRVKDLEEIVKSYQTSTPSAGTGKTGESASGKKIGLEAIDDYFK